MKSFKQFYESKVLNESHRQIPHNEDADDMFQEKDGVFYVNGYEMAEENYHRMKSYLQEKWTGKMLEDYELAVIPHATRRMVQEMQGDHKYFVNGMEVKTWEAFEELRKMLREFGDIAYFGRTPNFDHYKYLGDGMIVRVG